MVCLEDIYESIEDLPELLKDMLTTIRELDLVVQNSIDEKTRETEEFFDTAKNMQSANRESIFGALMLDFGKIVEDADEKINVAERLEKLMLDRLQLLDREIAEFKIGLEVEKPGVTSVIEEKMAKCDGQTSNRATKAKEQKKKRSKHNRKKSSASSSTVSSIDEVPAMKPQVVADLPVNPVNETTVSLNVEATVLEGTELAYDTTRYCVCNDLSYGDMIACDNQSCSREWFHYACVNLTVAPEGNWFCPACRPKKCTVPLQKC